MPESLRRQRSRSRRERQCGDTRARRLLQAAFRQLDARRLRPSDDASSFAQRPTSVEVEELTSRLGPLDEQQEIVRRVNVLLQSEARVTSLQRSASKRLRILTPSILQQAFRGELVPQDPSDEPASAVLARLGSAEIRKQKKVAIHRTQNVRVG